MTICCVRTLYIPAIGRFKVHIDYDMSQVIIMLLLDRNSNTSSSSTTYVRVYNDAWVVISGIILFIFFIFGVLANSITLAVIRNSKILKFVCMF